MVGKQLLAIAGAVLLILGSFLTWATADVFGFALSVEGTQGDGKLTLFLGLIALAVFVIPRPGSAIAGAIVAGLAGCLVLYNFANVQRQTSDLPPGVDVTAGVGLYVCFVGAVMAVVGGLLLFRVRRPLAPAPMTA